MLRGVCHFIDVYYLFVRHDIVDATPRVRRHASQLNAFIADNDFVVTSNEINQSVHDDDDQQRKKKKIWK